MTPSATPMKPSFPQAHFEQSEEALTLRARTWPAYAMMVHGMIDEVLRVMNEGGLMQPGAADRVQLMRTSMASPPQG